MQDQSQGDSDIEKSTLPDLRKTRKKVDRKVSQ